MSTKVQPTTGSGASYQRVKTARELALLLAFARAYWLMQGGRSCK